MGYEFKAGDWAVDDEQGERLFVVGVDSDGGVVCQPGSGMRCYDHEAEDLTPLPDCTGWDWVPAPAASDGSTEFIPFNSQADPVYVIASVERDAWDGAGFGEDLETSDECLILTPCGSVPGGSLFLLADSDVPCPTLHRLLVYGETIQADDQSWRDEGGWTAVSRKVVGFSVFEGCVPLRRKITR
jgi:hypothetical protein